jgi:hypothetical protein
MLKEKRRECVSAPSSRGDRSNFGLGERPESPRSQAAFPILLPLRRSAHDLAGRTPFRRPRAGLISRASQLAAALLLVLSARASAASPPVAGRTISSITIVTYNVFEREAFHDPKLLYWAADRFHHKTQERVIRNELLFAEGQPCDPALLAETERNIRGLAFIRRAEVLAVVNKQGKVDVVVRTYDAWTLEIIASFSRVGGQNNVRLGLGENNINGMGMALSGSYARSGGTHSSALKWKDSLLYGRKVEYTVTALTSPGTRVYAIGVNRPFFTSIIPSAFGFNAAHEDRVVPDYSGDVLLGSVRQQTTDIGANYGVAFATSTRRVRRMTVGVQHHIAEFSPAPGAVDPGLRPPDTHLNFLQWGGDWETFDFIKERQIQKFSHDEDVNLGFAALPTVAWSPPVPGKANQSKILPSLPLSKGFHWEAWESGQLLLLGGGYNTTYVESGGSSQVGRASLSYFGHGLPSQTVAVHAAYDHAFRLDPAAPLTLGEDTGLRGYGAGQFKGNRRLLMNVEDRLFIKNEIYTLIDLGAVVFFDTGCTWGKGADPKVSDLKSGVGLGLRLAPSRSGNNEPVRIDVAYALNPGGPGSHISVSILAGQAF